MLSNILLVTLLMLCRSTFADVACNGNVELCDRLYSNVSQIGTHDSAFVGELLTDSQSKSVAEQLAAGIRFLQAQVCIFAACYRINNLIDVSTDARFPGSSHALPHELLPGRFWSSGDIFEDHSRLSGSESKSSHHTAAYEWRRNIHVSIRQSHEVSRPEEVCLCSRKAIVHHGMANSSRAHRYKHKIGILHK